LLLLVAVVLLLVAVAELLLLLLLLLRGRKAIPLSCRRFQKVHTSSSFWGVVCQQ
jgi:hypothetical protein